MSKPLRLLIIAPRFGSINRGVEIFVRELIRRLDKKRFHVTILSGPHDQLLEDVEMVKMPLFSRERLAVWAKPFSSIFPKRWFLGPVELEALSLMFHSRDFFQKNVFDAILPFGGTWTYRFANKYRHGAHIISIGHGGPVLSDLLLSDLFVALTPTDEALARTICPGINTVVIPNGVDAACFKKAEKLPGQGAGKVKKILCAAALTEDKRHDLLFDAALRMDDSIHILCAGDGPMKPFLLQHPLYHKGRVEFVTKFHSDMPSLYQDADVFTLASPSEAFGLVFLEALASGLPVVAHDGPRQKYVVGDAGFFCNVYDPLSYLHALDQALNAVDNSIGVSHAKKFSWDSIALKYQELITDLCENNS